MTINPNKNTSKTQTFIENRVFEQRPSFISRITSRKPSVKKIAEFLNSSAGRQYIETKSLSEQKQIREYLTSVHTKISSQRIPGRIADLFRTLVGVKTKLYYAESALTSFNTNATAIRANRINQLVEKSDGAFLGVFNALNNEQASVVDVVLEAKINETKEINANGLFFYVTKISDPNQGNTGRVEVATREVNALAEGTFSAVYSINENNQKIIKLVKDQNQDITQEGYNGIKKDIEARQHIHKDEIKPCIHKPPHSVIQIHPSPEEPPKVKGCMESRYDGDAADFIEKKLNPENELPAEEKFAIAKMFISQNSRGLLEIFNAGYIHTDHKTANVLYNFIENRNIESYIADLGGDVKISDLSILITEYKDLQKQQPLEDGNNNEIEGKKYDVINDIIGAYTPNTTKSNDITRIRTYLNDNQADDIETSSYFIKQMGENRMVYANGITSLAYLCGLQEENLLENRTLFNSSRSLTPQSLDAFKEALTKYNEEKNLAINLSNEESQMIYNSLNNDPTLRPTLEEFAATFPYNPNND